MTQFGQRGSSGDISEEADFEGFAKEQVFVVQNLPLDIFGQGVSTLPHFPLTCLSQVK